MCNYTIDYPESLQKKKQGMMRGELGQIELRQHSGGDHEIYNMVATTCEVGLAS